ncbi:MAG: hypothetical protein AAFN07_15355 [Pseudomonadota bacterium]
MRINDAESLNQFAEELEAKRDELVQQLVDANKEEISSIVDSLSSASIEDRLLWEWREAKRFEELYPKVFADGIENGFWRQYLLDLRLSGEIDTATVFLDRLYKLHWESFRPLLRRAESLGNEPGFVARLDTQRGRVAEVLFEMLFLAESCDEEVAAEALRKRATKRINSLNEAGR